MAGTQPRELPSRGGCLLADKGLALGRRSSGEFGGNMLVGGAAGTAGHMPVGMEEGLAGKGWGEHKYLLGGAGSGHHASWVSHRLAGSTAQQPGHGASAHI